MFRYLIFASLIIASAANADELTSSAVNADELRIVNIRVGQGDATLIQGPPDAATGKRVSVLFDAGNTGGLDGGYILRTVLKKYGVIDYLDYMVVSHDDADHIGGIVYGDVKQKNGVIKRMSHGRSFILGGDNTPGCAKPTGYDNSHNWLGDTAHYFPDPKELGKCDDMTIGTFVDYGESNMRDTNAIRKYNAIANAFGNRIELATQQDVDNYEIDLGSGARMIAYAANGFTRGTESGKPDPKADAPNELSLAFLVTYGTFDFLIAGDLIGKHGGRCKKGKWVVSRGDATNSSGEKALGRAIKKAKVNVDVLHVNHHGADNASSTQFLKDINANIAVISAGNGNTHEHPDEDVLERLYNAGIYQIIQTSGKA